MLSESALSWEEPSSRSTSWRRAPETNASSEPVPQSRSREAREVIELRDDVLDEITQLYFERGRVLVELAAAQTPEEALRLRLRAAELAAGIDAWTGGWFSRALREAAP